MFKIFGIKMATLIKIIKTLNYNKHFHHIPKLYNYSLSISMQEYLNKIPTKNKALKEA